MGAGAALRRDGQGADGPGHGPTSELSRRPDHRSQIDVEIHGSNPEERSASSLSAVATLLDGIDGLRTSAEDLAPQDWRDRYRAASDNGGLFLEGFEFHDNGLVRVLFDFGDLDLLVLDLHRSGERTVSIEP